MSQFTYAFAGSPFTISWQLQPYRDFRDVLKIMENGRWDIESIITHEYSLNDISEAIETAAQSDTAFNVVIKF